MIISDTLEKYQEIYNKYGGIKPCTVICCADHGVAEENVSAYSQATTAQMVRNYVNSKGAAANAFANFAKCAMLVVDVGVNDDLSDLESLVIRKIALSTQNMTKGAAMSIEQAEKSIDIGLEIAHTLSKSGYNCFLPGEMGIGNTTSSAAITSMLLNVAPELVTGRGTNISDERLAHKIDVVKKAININSPNLSQSVNTKQNAIEILSMVGGFEIGAMAGIIIGAWRTRSLVILDGFNTAVAALVAHAIEPACLDCLIASHVGREKGHKLILDALDLYPVLHLNLALGEAIGSSILLKILDNLTSNSDDDDIDFEDEEDDEDNGLDSYEQLFNDEEFDIELNIYNTDGPDQRYLDDFDEDDFYVDFKQLDDNNISVTDRTFNFYLNTMPRLDKQSMQRSMDYIDSLSKPLGSLGLLEEIVTQIAGISTESQPSYRLKSNIICFTDNTEEFKNAKAFCDDDDEFDPDNPLIDIYDVAEDFDVSLTFALIAKAKDTATAFDFGRMTAEDVTFKVPIVGISVASDLQNDNDISSELEDILLTGDGKLKFKADEFLRQIPKSRQNLVSSVIGAIVSAAHNSSLVIVDCGAVSLIARYVEQLCPAVRPYILHADKLFFDDDGLPEEHDGECTCIAIEIVRAALFAISNMKTFKETGVSTAIDGLGVNRQ